MARLSGAFCGTSISGCEPLSGAENSLLAVWGAGAVADVVRGSRSTAQLSGAFCGSTISGCEPLGGGVMVTASASAELPSNSAPLAQSVFNFVMTDSCWIGYLPSHGWREPIDKRGSWHEFRNLGIASRRYLCCGQRSRDIPLRLGIEAAKKLSGASWCDAPDGGKITAGAAIGADSPWAGRWPSRRRRPSRAGPASAPRRG